MIKLRHAALAAIAVLVTGSAVASFCESYRGLFIWAHEHGLRGIWAAGFPLQVDTFIAVGELALFVALADSWKLRSRAGAWVVTVLGMAVSVAGNVGHISGHDLASRATAAVPPLAAAAALAVGLGVLKRVVAARSEIADSVTAGPVSVTAEPVNVTPAQVSQPVTLPASDRPAIAAKRPATRKKSGAKHGRPSAAVTEAEALTILAGQPDISGGALARELGVSPRTGQRLLNKLSDRQPATP